MPRRPRRRSASLLATALLAGLLSSLVGIDGCVERKLTVTSDPPGALVVLNNQEVGRTPMTRDFLWYGTYDVQLRREGYETLKVRQRMIAPWWQWVPIDLAADVIPLRFSDDRTMHFTLVEATGEAEDPNAVLARATKLQSRLLGSGNTRPPTSRPTTRQASSQPTTSP